ncbi:MAG: hypothetical protein M0Z28_13405, partial [Rhodospirillales bacterium]|nr:hypothetical protein [Rhodospirillales bacterium]
RIFLLAGPFVASTVVLVASTVFLTIERPAIMHGRNIYRVLKCRMVVACADWRGEGTTATSAVSVFRRTARRD